MKKEKVILSFIAAFVGVVVAGVAFYLYQSTKVLPASTVNKYTPTPTPKPTISQQQSVLLTLDTPKDEDVTDKKTISVVGKTDPNATIVVSGENSDQVVTPAQNGTFSLTYTLSDGANLIEITAIGQNGQETKLTRTITVSSESF